MTDVFISYKKEERHLASMLAQALSTHFLTVWWDKELKSGQEFRKEIKKRLDAAGAVVVIWSKISITSDFVLAEANAGKRAGKLVPVMFENAVKIPPPFDEIQSQSLEEWTGDHMDPRILSLIGQIDAARPSRVSSDAAQMASSNVNVVNRSVNVANVVTSILRSFKFLAFYGLPLYRLTGGALVVGSLVMALWFVPAVLQNNHAGSWLIVFGPAVISVFFARVLYQAATVFSGRYSRQFFDAPFAFWSGVSMIAALLASALFQPINQITVMSIIQSVPVYFCGVIFLCMLVRVTAAIFGKFLFKG